MRQVTKCHLNDVRGDRRRRLHRVPGQVGLHAGGDRQDHGFADRARDTEDAGCGQAGNCGRDDDVDRGVKLGRAHRVRAFAQAHRHRTHCILGQRSDVGHDHDAHYQPGGKQRKTRQLGEHFLQQRSDDQQGEVAEDDGRDAAQQFEHRLGELTHLRIGELGQVDGDDRAHRDGERQRNSGRHQRARDEDHDAVVGIVKQRGPLGVGKEIDDADLVEKDDGLGDEHIDDAKRRQHRHCGSSEQYGFDQALAELAHGVSGQAIADLRQVGNRACGHGEIHLKSPFGSKAGPVPEQPGNSLAATGRNGPSHAAYMLASRFISSSMVIPTSFLPPKTVPILLSLTCLRLPS